MRDFMANFIKKIVIVLLITLLSGCFMFSQDSQDKSGKDHFASLVKKLAVHNVDTYRHGNKVSLLLPSKYFFTARSANFKENSYKTLEFILALSSHFRESPLVTVVGYHNNKYGSRYDKALAIERARRVVQYLWNAGIDVTFMYADGKRVLKDSKKCGADCVVIEFKPKIGS